MLNFPSGFSRLVRLSLLRVGSVSFCYSIRSDAFPALEMIHLHSAHSIDLNHLLSASPRLRTLDLRYCEFLDTEGDIYVTPARGHLSSLTVAECDGVTHIHAGRASGLRSFRLRSALLPTYNMLSTAPLDDLYICLRGHNYNPLKQWIKDLPNLTNLTVLTICSIALRRVYALARFGSATCLTNLRSLPSLRELQLLMFATASINLAHIYMFLRTCWCPQLERLFVQLPTSSHDTSVGNSSEVVEEDDEPDEVSEVDQPDEVLSKKDEPDEGLSEEDEPHEELSEEDETDGDLSEEDETEEELLKEKLLQEYMLEERPYYEDVYEEDSLDENVPQEEQFEEDMPEYDLNSLMIAKMMKFKGQYFEMRLVSFLLRKAPGLKKLLLVAHKGHIKALGKDTLDIS